VGHQQLLSRNMTGLVINAGELSRPSNGCKSCCDNSMHTCHACPFVMLLQQSLTFLPQTGVVQSLSVAVCVQYKHSLLTCFIMANTLKKKQKGKSSQLRSSVPAVAIPCPTCNLRQIPKGSSASPREAVGPADCCDQALQFQAKLLIGWQFRQLQDKRRFLLYDRDWRLVQRCQQLLLQLLIVLAPAQQHAQRDMLC